MLVIRSTEELLRHLKQQMAGLKTQGNANGPSYRKAHVAALQIGLGIAVEAVEALLRHEREGVCPDDPGDGSIYTCHDLTCPLHGQRNRLVARQEAHRDEWTTEDILKREG